MSGTKVRSIYKSEAAFYQRIKRDLASLPGCSFFRVETSTMHGFPDLIILYNGRAFFLELKNTGNKATAIQRAIIDMIKRSMGISFVMTPDLWLPFLEKLKEVPPLLDMDAFCFYP